MKAVFLSGSEVIDGGRSILSFSVQNDLQPQRLKNATTDGWSSEAAPTPGCLVMLSSSTDSRNLDSADTRRDIRVRGREDVRNTLMSAVNKWIWEENEEERSFI